MTNVFILIMVILSTEGSTIATAEFENVVSCQRAGESFVLMNQLEYPKFDYRCVQK